MTVYERDELIVSREDAPAAPLRLLVIDDDEIQTRIFTRMLGDDYPGAFSVTGELTLGQGLERLERERFDCVLLDHRLPDGHGVMSIDRVQARAGDIPIIILTGMRDPELEFAALAGGAQDYLAKDDTTAPMIRKAVLYAIERARLQNGLMTAQADQLNVQREFFSHVSHELRTPVAAMYLSATNLGDGLLGKVSPEQREAVEVIADNVQQLRRLVDDLLDATRMAEGKVPIDLGRVDVVGLATAAARRHQGRSALVDATATVYARDDVPAALGDRQRVVQILDNLLSNAAKYATGTPIEITVDHEPALGRLVVAVADRGPGVPAEDRERVFERMVQLEGTVHHPRRGLGLGLYIARDLAVRMGGDMDVVETEGGGATFRLTLPVHPIDALAWAELQHGKPSRALEATVVDVDVFAGRGVLNGTELADDLIARVQTSLTALPDVAVIRRGGHVLRCVSLSVDPKLEQAITNTLSQITTLADAGMNPTITERQVRVPKSRRRPLSERLEDVATAILG